MKVYCLINIPGFGSAKVIEVFNNKDMALQELYKIKENNYMYLFSEADNTLTFSNNDVYQIQEVNLNTKEINE